MKPSSIAVAVALTAPLSCLIAIAPAHAQSATTGAIRGRVVTADTGDPLAGVTVVVTGAASQTAVSSDDGTYAVTDLVPGEYLVTFFFGDLTIERRGVRVGINRTTPVFQKIDLDAAIDTKILIEDDGDDHVDPYEIAPTFRARRDYIDHVPAPGRGFIAIATAAAGAGSDAAGVTVGGSTSLENQYVVDGINTTGLRYGTVGSPVVRDFIDELEVITGGYNAEYGRSTGGVINVATLTGGNDFAGRIFAYLTPGALTAAKDGAVSEASSIDTTVDDRVDASLGFTLSGPIVKDRAWFAIGVAPRYVQRSITRTTKRLQDCQRQEADGRLSPCDPRSIGDGGFGDGVADVDPATGFRIFQPLDTEIRRPDQVTLPILAKVNVAVAPEHQGQLSLSTTPSRARNYGVYGLRTSTDTTTTGLGLDLGLKWTSKFHDGKTEVEASLGWHRDHGAGRANHPGARHAPFEVLRFGNLGNWGNITDLDGRPAESALTRAGCADGPDDLYPFITNCPDEGVGYRVGGVGGLLDNTEDRYALRLGAIRRAELAGTHELKAGVDVEDNLLDEPRAYTGGVYYENRQDAGVILVNRYVQVGPGDTTDPRFDAMCTYGAGPDEQRPCRYIGETGEGARIQGETLNWAAYLRDSWRPRPNLTISAGVRYEEQRLRFAEYLRDEVDPLTNRPFGANAIVMTGMVAPRVGLLYDWTREGRSKIYGHWGRFFESIPMDINSRSFAGEATFRQVIAADDCTDPIPEGEPGAQGYGGPSGRQCPGALLDRAAGDILGLEGTAVAPGLKPQYMDEWLGGVEYEVMEDLKVGVGFQHRSLGRVIEDVSTDNASTYIIANPGEWSEDEEDALEAELAAATAAGDADAMARLDNLLTQFRGIRMFDRPSRTYDALQFTAALRPSRALFVQASYVYARTKGNYPGLIAYDTGQIDPNISSQYDLIELLGNRMGPLPQDRPHALKVDGYYQFDLARAGTLTVGGRLRAQSGTPRQALAAHWLYGQGEAFLLPRGQIGRTAIETGVDLHLGYGKPLAHGMAIEVFADLFNLINHQGTAGVDDTYSYQSSANPIAGGTYDDLVFAKENNDRSGAETPEPIKRNPNYGNVSARYEPRSVQLGVRLSF